MISKDLQHQGADGGGVQLMDNGGAASRRIRCLAFLPNKVTHTEGAILKPVKRGLMKRLDKLCIHIVV